MSTPNLTDAVGGKRRAAPAELGVALVVAVVVVFFALRLPDFRSVANIRLLMKQSAELAIISTGMTLVIATGGIDISVGSVMALCAMTMGWLAVDMHLPLPAACLGAILLGAACGTLNGALIARLKLPPIIVTLAMYAAAAAAASMFHSGHSISGLPPALNDTFDRTNLLGQPILFWIGIATLTAGGVLLTRTGFGRQLLALGGNRVTARLSGLPTTLTETLVYAVSGGLAGFAAVINVAKESTATPDTGQFMELTAITAVVLGGTVITGGQATLLGTALGVFAIGAIKSGVRLFGQEDQLAWFIVGASLLLAVEAQKWRAAKSVQA